MQDNNRKTKLEQAWDYIDKIDREKDGVSLEQAIKWLAENWSKLYLRHGKEAEDVLKIFFEKFYKQNSEVEDSSLQPVLGLCIAEEEHKDFEEIMAWFCGTNSWAYLWRTFLEEKGIKTKKSHEDRDDCTLIEKALWKAVNDQRYKRNLKPLEHHYLHAKHATGHSQNMAESGEVFNAPSYFAQSDNFLAEDVAKIPFVPHKHRDVARGIFDQIVGKGNVFDCEFTGIGIGLWKKDGFVYVTLRYSTICLPKKDLEEE